MIGIIKAEWRKLAWRPANLVAIGGLLAVVALIYSVGYIEYTWPAASQAARAALLKQALYPGGLVKNLMNGVMPLGAAMTLVLGGLATGSEYGWGTLKTVLTQGPGRIQTWVAKMAAAALGVAVLTALFYAAGAIASLIVAGVDGHSIAWPATVDIAKAMGATWLILYCFGLLGMALGFVFRQAAAAVGIGLVYFVLVETILTRFITGFHGGDYKWIANGLSGANATALVQSFGQIVVDPRAPAPVVGGTQAVLTLAAYAVAFALVSATLLRRRDVQ
ncbi:MAG TPA: ABC transporter permease [Candidatus Dormibacteraeota bacterium]|nr:ABC transporter permease [Candidatus Dormibacteraeota bacterium]